MRERERERERECDKEKKELLTAFLMQYDIVPDKAAAIPNLPLLRMFMATLNPSPTPKDRCNTTIMDTATD